MIKKRIMLTFICLLTGCVLIVACRKNDKKEQENTSEITVSPTVTPTKAAEDTKDYTGESDTKDTGDQTGSETETDYVSEKEAVKFIQDITGERGYYFELLDDNLSIGDSTYYIYQISEGDSSIEPNVLVDKVSGELLCYYPDGSTGPFSEHPLYTEPVTDEDSKTSGGKEFTQEDALAQLSKVPLKELGLSEKLTEYNIEFDDWPTNIEGTECYGINVYSGAGDKRINKGNFYVATDGSVMYKHDSELDVFVEIKAQ